MRVLVTGGAGFVGSHVVDGLLSRGEEVLVADDLSTGSELNLAEGGALQRVDIADAHALRHAFEGQRLDAVVHAAAEARVVVSVADPARSERVNVQGTRNVLDLAKGAGASRFVLFSTGGALYGETPLCAKEADPARPLSPYGAHKLEAEALVRASGLSHAILRPANIYGPRQRGDLEAGVVAIFLQRWREGRELVIYGDGAAERDYVYVEDVVHAALSVLDRSDDATWNVGTGVATSVSGLVDILRRHLGEPPAGVRHAPPREGELQRACVDPAKAARDGVLRTRYSLDDGIASLLRSEF